MDAARGVHLCHYRDGVARALVDWPQSLQSLSGGAQIMAITTQSPTSGRAGASARGNSILTTLMLIGLLIGVAIFGIPVVQALITGHPVPPPPLILSLAGLVVAGVVATRWRWACVLALTFGLIVLVILLTPGGFPFYNLTHPIGNLRTFASFVVYTTAHLLVVIASGAALVQAVRKETPHGPRWLHAAVTGIVCLTIGALLVGGNAQGGSVGAANTAAGTEVTHLTADTFAPDIIALHKGDTLTVVDDASVPHILTNGSWGTSGQAQPSTEAGAPTIKNVQISSGSVVLGPFTTPGTYHIYCIVHPGMDLTVIVQ
jgi:plastocyanin